MPDWVYVPLDKKFAAAMAACQTTDDFLALIGGEDLPIVDHHLPPRKKWWKKWPPWKR